MQTTREHYNQLQENFKQTRHLMSDADCEDMRLRLNIWRRVLAREACAKEWKEGGTINVGDFLLVCAEVGIEIPESTENWILADLLEVGCNNYSCIGKIGKRKENILLKICLELNTKI
jgi:hypothetical protein